MQRCHTVREAHTVSSQCVKQSAAQLIAENRTIIVLLLAREHHCGASLELMPDRTGQTRQPTHQTLPSLARPWQAEQARGHPLVPARILRLFEGWHGPVPLTAQPSLLASAIGGTPTHTIAASARRHQPLHTGSGQRETIQIIFLLSCDQL